MKISQLNDITNDPQFIADVLGNLLREEVSLPWSNKVFHSNPMVEIVRPVNYDLFILSCSKFNLTHKGLSTKELIARAEVARIKLKPWGVDKPTEFTALPC